MGIYYRHVGVGTAPEGLHVVGYHRLVENSRVIIRRGFCAFVGWAAFAAEAVLDGPLFGHRSRMVDSKFRLTV